MKQALGIFVGLLLLASCGPNYVPGTKIPDTVENREILDMVEDYRMALENRDVAALAQMVSRSYFENASSTAVTDDDYGYEALLRRVLPVLRDNIKKVMYEVKVDRILVKGRQASVFFEWELQCQYVEGGLEGWSTAKDKNRMDLVMEDGRWKIVAGL